MRIDKNLLSGDCRKSGGVSELLDKQSAANTSAIVDRLSPLVLGGHAD
jgi:hypothetical protein